MNMTVKRTAAVIGMLAMLDGAYIAGGQTLSRGTEGTKVQKTGSAGQEERRGGPPAEAYMACEGKAEGATAQFTNPEGEVVTGICRVADGKLVLRPDHPNGNVQDKHQGPPPEAYKACEGKKAGSTSQFVDPRGETLKGTCEEENGNMVLRPDRNRTGKQGKAAGADGGDR